MSDPADPPAPQDPPQDPPQEGNVEELPQWAREALTKANKEAASYRTKVRELEPLASKAREAEEATKSEIQKANEQLAEAQRKAQEAELRAMRLEVATEKGLTKSQAKRLVGSTREELEVDADELLADFGGESKPPPPATKPSERLRGGGDPTEEPEEMDPRKLADSAVPYRGF